MLREDGRRGIVDLMLSRASRHRQGERHHLVVELKRPSVVVGMEEFGQVTGYAQAVRQDDRFRDTRVTWDFWLVGNTMDDSLRQMAAQPDRQPGCVVDQPTYRIWARTWGETIADCEERLRFYRDQLEYFSEEERAEWTHRLGNPVLLNRSKNSVAQNYDFSVKKAKYFTGRSGVVPFALTIQVLQHADWTPDLLRARQKHLCGDAEQ